MILEKHHRLPHEIYRGRKIVSFTACIRNKEPFFTTPDRFAAFEHVLIKALKQFNCEAEIYLFMPDHAHLVLCGSSDDADVMGAMGLFKQRSGFWLSRNHPSVHWQKDFYDHILRNDESIEKHIRYVLENPLRKGFVKHWKEYPFKGSTVYNLERWDP